MAKRFLSVLAAAALMGLSPPLIADDSFPINDAIRLVVITGDEGIHYERGCPFYELRGLLAENESGAMDADALTSPPLFEIRLIGKSGNSTVYVGNHWMRTVAGTMSLPVKVYERIAELIAMRKGEGVPKTRIDASIQRATKLIRHPKYVEDNRCAAKS